MSCLYTFLVKLFRSMRDLSPSSQRLFICNNAFMKFATCRLWQCDEAYMCQNKSTRPAGNYKWQVLQGI